MVVTDALTFTAMLLCAALSILFALLKLPEIAAFFVVCCYYFSIFHIAHIVGDSRGWYRDVLPTYFGLLTLTIITFAIIYYRSGLLADGEHREISIIESLYFSVTTWTTLGYGDFAPPLRIRHITSVEAILGYVGLGLWVFLISSFITNMAENRRLVRKHNDQLFNRIKDQPTGCSEPPNQQVRDRREAAPSEREPEAPSQVSTFVKKKLMRLKLLLLLLKEDSLLYLRTEWRLHLVFAVLFCTVSFGISFCLSDPTIFSRSGSMVVFVAAIMMYRSHMRKTEEDFMRITGRADRRAFKEWNPFTSKEEAKQEDCRAFQWGFLLVFLGTLIWGYGDLALKGLIE